MTKAEIRKLALDKYEELYELVDKNLHDGMLNKLAKIPLRNSLFIVGYGSAAKGSHPHHNYAGGLIIHTWEVLDAAIRSSTGFVLGSTGNWESYPNIEDIIIGTIWHDYGKIWDYESETGEGTSHRQLIRHVARSFTEFMQASNNLSEKRQKKIGHIILSHHGRMEWGSPVEPETLEAYIVHYADYLSMKFGRYAHIKVED